MESRYFLAGLCLAQLGSTNLTYTVYVDLASGHGSPICRRGEIGPASTGEGPAMINLIAGVYFWLFRPRERKPDNRFCPHPTFNFLDS